MGWNKNNAPASTADLPAEALDIWLQVGNAGLKLFVDHSDAFDLASDAAFNGLKKAGWSKGDDGTWAKTTQTTDQDFDLDAYIAFLADGGDATHTIDKTEVLVTGDHTDRDGKVLTVTRGYLDKVVANFTKLSGVLKPPVKLGHDRQSILKRSGFPAAGWVTALWREGETLFAKLEDIPDKVFRLIQKKAYRRKSSELRGNFTHKGVSFGPVFWGLAFIGEEIPAIKTLDDILALTDEDDSPSLFVDAKEGGNKLELTQEELDRRTKEAGDKAKATAQAEFTEKETAMKADADKTTEELAALKATGRKDKIAAFTERLAEAKVATIFTKEMGLSTFLEGLDADEVVEFTDGDKGKATAMDFAMGFTEALVKAATDGKLFVKDGELAPGAPDEDAKEFVDGKPISTEESDTAKRLVESQKGQKTEL